jgi:hypothetical protein
MGKLFAQLYLLETQVDLLTSPTIATRPCASVSPTNTATPKNVSKQPRKLSTPSPKTKIPSWKPKLQTSVRR